MFPAHHPDRRQGGDRPTGPAATGRRPRHGTFAGGIRYVTWGAGPRTLLFIAGEEAPTGLTLRTYRWLLRPYIDAGYAVWFVGRRHPMPEDFTVANMGEDYARVIGDEFDGRVDLIVGVSTGGMIGQYLAARHPLSFGSIALVAAAAEMTGVGKDINLRSAEAVARGDRTQAGAILSEVVPSERLGWLRRLIGAALGRALPSDQPADFLTAARALNAFDSWELLPGIRVPVLLICGDRDAYFAADMIEETARLIPDCTLLWYRGRSHPQVAAGSRQVARDVLAFVGQQKPPAPPSAGAPGPSVTELVPEPAQGQHAGTTSRGAAVEPQPITDGDYGYDEAHPEPAGTATPAAGTEREHVGPSPAVGRPDLAEDFSYDQAHDF